MCLCNSIMFPFITCSHLVGILLEFNFKFLSYRYIISCLLPFSKRVLLEKQKKKKKKIAVLVYLLYMPGFLRRYRDSMGTFKITCNTRMKKINGYKLLSKNPIYTKRFKAQTFLKLFLRGHASTIGGSAVTCRSCHYLQFFVEHLWCLRRE